MSRIVRVAAAQMGPTQRADSREHTLQRLIALLEQAAARGARLVVFPELALTTFFPRWLLQPRELDQYFEPAMPHPGVQLLFDCARALNIGFYLGYAERAPDGQRFNSAVIVSPEGEVVGKYRKVHLPGSVEPRPGERFQQLEKRYFAYGDLGFPAFRAPPSLGDGVLGMLICNDRRWPEAWRVLGLQGVEMVLVGYNSAAYDPNGGTSEDAALRTFHSRLAAQANAYMNATWAVAVAKAGDEDGSGLIGGSCIVDPNGLVTAETSTLEDEVVVADCDLDLCRQGKEKMFHFAAHRRPDQYRPIVDQVGAVPPGAVQVGMRRLLPALLPVALGAAGCTLPPPYPVIPASAAGTAGRPYDLIGPYDAVQPPPRFEARPLPPPPPPAVSAPLDLVPFDPAPPRSASRPDPDQPSDPDTASPSATTAATGSTPRSDRPSAQSSSAASPTPAAAASRTPAEERGAERSSAVPLEGFRPLGGVSRRSQLSH